jgi:hypothetical protein
MDRISYGWDSMIDRAHEGSAKYERITRELARPDRFTEYGYHVVLGHTTSFCISPQPLE